MLSMQRAAVMRTPAQLKLELCRDFYRIENKLEKASDIKAHVQEDQDKFYLFHRRLAKVRVRIIWMTAMWAAAGASVLFILH